MQVSILTKHKIIKTQLQIAEFFTPPPLVQMTSPGHDGWCVEKSYID